MAGICRVSAVFLETFWSDGSRLGHMDLGNNILIEIITIINIGYIYSVIDRVLVDEPELPKMCVVVFALPGFWIGVHGADDVRMWIAGNGVHSDVFRVIILKFCHFRTDTNEPYCHNGFKRTVLLAPIIFL